MISIHDIAKNYGAEMALLVLLCRVGQRRAAKNDVVVHISQSSIDWKLFASIIAAHQLKPLAYKVLSEVPGAVDAEFIDRLRTASLKIASGNLMKLDALNKLHVAFNDREVANIPYKGVLLSKLIYDDFVSRETADIDFLIRQQDFNAAKAVLVENGFKPGYFFQQKFEKKFVAAETEMLFVKHTPIAPIKVEIHWDITSRMLDMPMDIQQLFDNSTSDLVLDKQVQVLSDEDLFLVLLVHHGVADVWRSLRHVVDLAAILDSDANTLLPSEQVNERIAKLGLLKTSAIGTQLCYDLLGVGTDSRISQTRTYQSVLHNLLTFPALKKQKLALENIRQQFLLRDNFKYQLSLAFSYVKAALTPNIRDVETLALPPRLYFLYYLLKPFLLLARKK